MIVLAVVANKSDKYEDEKVDEEEGKQFAKSIGAIFKYTSAMKHQGIEVCLIYFNFWICLRR